MWTLPSKTRQNSAMKNSVLKISAFSNRGRPSNSRFAPSLSMKMILFQIALKVKVDSKTRTEVNLFYDRGHIVGK